MMRAAIIVLAGSLLAACSAKVPVSSARPTAHLIVHKYVPPMPPKRDEGWIDPPQVGPAPGVPEFAGLD